MCTRCDELESHIDQLMEALGANGAPQYGLTRAEWTLVAPLLRKQQTGQEPVMSYEALQTVYEAANRRYRDVLTDGTLKVLISRARPKLKPHGWEIQPVHKFGYRLVRAPGATGKEAA